MSGDESNYVRLRHVATLNPPVPVGVRTQLDTELPFLPMEAIHEYGGYDGSRRRPVRELLAGYSYFENGDILFAKVTPCFENGKATIITGLEGGRGFGTTEVTVVRPDKIVDIRFLFYVLIENHFNQLGQSVMTGAGGLKRVSESFTKNFKFWLPDIDRQRAISDFIDRETSEIDSFITDQEMLIGLFEERLIATIGHAVTKGLVEDVPLKDGGVHWIGEVPETWNVTKLGYAYEVLLGKMLDGAKVASKGAIELPYIRAGNIQDDGLNLSNVNKMYFTSSEAQRLSLLEGDLLVVEGGSIGTSQVLQHDMPGWSFQKTVNRIRSRGEDSTLFLSHVIRTYRDAEVFDVICNRSTIAHLTAEKLHALKIPLPPPSVQSAIVDYLERETTEIDAAIADAREAIALSLERRAALISAAVAGMIDVRDWSESTERVLESHGVA